MSLFVASGFYIPAATPTADLPNVQVYPGGHYIISNQTFPTYFLNQDTDAAAVQAELDLALFAEVRIYWQLFFHIFPVFEKR